MNQAANCFSYLHHVHLNTFVYLVSLLHSVCVDAWVTFWHSILSHHLVSLIDYQFNDLHYLHLNSCFLCSFGWGSFNLVKTSSKISFMLIIFYCVCYFLEFNKSLLFSQDFQALFCHLILTLINY